MKPAIDALAQSLAVTPMAIALGFVGILHSGYDRMYPLSDPPNYEPTPADSVAGRAAAAGAQPDELLYDLLLDDDGSRLLYIPLMNYARGDLADVREMLSVIATQVAVSLQNGLLYKQMETMATTDGLTGLNTLKSLLEQRAMA